jgi:hypothetical protein
MRKLLLVLSFFAFSSPLWAQSSDVQEGGGAGFEVGLKTGLNNTWIIIDNELQNNEHHKSHFNVKPSPIGVSAGYKINDQASIMMEGFWSKQGANFDLKDGNGNVVGEKEIKLEYLVVPLLFKFTGAADTRFAMQIGAQMAFLLEGNETNTFTQDVTVTNGNMPNNGQTITSGTYLLATTDADKQKDVPGRFNKKDINAVVDLGVEHDFNPDCYLSVGLRLVYGFKDIRAEESEASQFDLDKYTLRYNVTGGIHVGIHWFL